MKNKTVIRKKTKSGEFTTIHNSILNDTRLTPLALKLLVQILSDSDDFTLSQTLYMNRLGIKENRTYLHAISNLEKCGYLKRKEIDKDKSIAGIKKANSSKLVYHYTISEFGNLYNEPEIQKGEVIPSKISLETKQKEFNEFIELNADILDSNDFIYSKCINEITNGCIDIEVIKKIIEEEKEIKKHLKLFYNKCLEDIQSLIKPNQDKSVKDFKEWLKNEVFTNRNLDLDYISVRSKYSKISLIKNAKKFVTDYETMMGDYHENPKD